MSIENEFETLRQQLENMSSEPASANSPKQKRSNEFIVTKRLINEFKKRRITKEEYDWCNNHFCDPKVARHIHSLTIS